MSNNIVRHLSQIVDCINYLRSDIIPKTDHFFSLVQFTVRSMILGSNGEYLKPWSEWTYCINQCSHLTRRGRSRECNVIGGCTDLGPLRETQTCDKAEHCSRKYPLSEIAEKLRTPNNIYHVICPIWYTELSFISFSLMNVK